MICDACAWSAHVVERPYGFATEGQLAGRFLHLGTGTAAWATQLMPDWVVSVPAALAGSPPPLARMRSMLSSVRTVSLRTASLRVVFFIASR